MQKCRVNCEVLRVVSGRGGEEPADGFPAPLLPMQPHLPANKAQGAPGPEQQHLLTTAPSSSSSSLESSTSTTDKKAPIRSQLQAPGAEKASMTGEAQTSCGSSGKRWELPLRPTPGFIPCGTPPRFFLVSV